MSYKNYMSLKCFTMYKFRYPVDLDDYDIFNYSF